MRRETGLFLLSPVRSDFKKNRTYITGNPLFEKGAIVEIACRRQPATINTKRTAKSQHLEELPNFPSVYDIEAECI
jgi:hypothetical protein